MAHVFDAQDGDIRSALDEDVRYAEVLVGRNNVLNLPAQGSFVEARSIDAYQLGARDFTFEAFVSTPQGGTVASMSSAAHDVLVLDIEKNGDLVVRSGAAVVLRVGERTHALDGRWHHVAIVRENGVIALYLDGVKQATASGTAIALSDLTHVRIGSQGGDRSRTLIGHVTEARFWSVARSREDLLSTIFHRVVPAAELLAYWPYADGTFRDLSMHNNHGEGRGDAAFAIARVAFEPVSGALVLTGRSSSVTIPSHAAYEFGKEAFTLELWMFAGSPGDILSCDGGSDRSPGFRLWCDPKGHVVFSMTGAHGGYAKVSQPESAPSIFGEWHHVAIVRESAERALRLFIDGLCVASAAEAGSVVLPGGSALVFGQAAPTVLVVDEILQAFAKEHAEGPPAVASQPFALQLSDVRLWKTARSVDQIYRNTLVEPHDDHPDLVGYWNFETGNVVDRSRTANLRTSVHGADVAAGSQALSKPQHVVVLGDGGQGYMKVPSQDAFDFGVGDFCLEARFASGSARTLLSRAADSQSFGMHLRVTSSRLELIVANADGSQSTTYAAEVTLLDDRWHHVAFVRKNKRMACFVDMRMHACAPLQSEQHIASKQPLFAGIHRAHESSDAMETGKLRVDFLYIWKEARDLADLQRSTYVAIGGAERGLVGAWTFDQRAPIDVSLTGANGTLGRDAVIVADYELPVTVPVSDLHFSGSGVLDCGSRADLAFREREKYTIAAWVSPGVDDPSGTIVARFHPASRTGYRLRLDRGIVVAERSATAVRGITRLKRGHWYFVAMTFDSERLSVWINGVPEGSAASDAISDSPARLTVGATGTGSDATDFLRGNVSEVQVWSRVFRPAEFGEIMDAAITGAEADLRAYWNFTYAFSDDWTGRSAAAVGQHTQYVARSFVRPVSGAHSFDGTGGHVACGTDHSLNLRNAMTIEARVRFNASVPGQIILAKGESYQLLQGEDNQVVFRTGGITPRDLSTKADPARNFVDFMDGCWHHVAATYDGKEKRIYVDGRLNNAVAAGGTAVTDDVMVFVGDTTPWANRVLGIDPKSGETRSVIELGATGSAGSPVMTRDGIMVMRGQHGIVGVDSEAGSVLWRHTLADGGAGSLFPAPTLHRGRAFVSAHPDGIFAFNVKSGRPTKISARGSQTHALAIQDDVLCYAAGNMLCAIDLRTGRSISEWSAPTFIRYGPLFVRPDTVVLSYNTIEGQAVIVPLRVGSRFVEGAAFRHTTSFTQMVVEDGVVYLRDRKGDIYALKYADHGLTRAWSTQLPEASWAPKSLAVESPYAIAVYGDSLVAMHASDGRALYRGGPPGMHGRRGVTLANNIAYSWRGDRSLEAYDIARDWGREPLQPMWVTPSHRETLPTSVCVKSAPLSIGARIDPKGTPVRGFNGLIADVRLWSSSRSEVEIEATWQRRLIGNESNLRAYYTGGDLKNRRMEDRSSHQNRGRIVGDVHSAMVDFTLADPLPYIEAQSRMMQQWSPKDQAGANVRGSIAFRTEIRVFDGNRQPLRRGAVRIWSDEPCTIVVDGVEYQIDAERAALLATNATGVVAVTAPVPANCLTSPTLQMWVDAMPMKHRVVIHPDDNLNYTLATISGADLRDPSSSKNPLLKAKKPLRAFDEREADALASAINSAVRQVKRPVDRAFGLPTRQDALDATSARNPRDNAKSVFWDGQRYRQEVVAASSAWRFDFRKKTFAVLSDDEAREACALPAEAAVTTKDDPAFKSLWGRFVSGLLDVVDIVVTGVTYVVKYVENAVEKFIRAAFEAVKEVGQAIFALFRNLVEATEKIYEFFAFLFDWGDIVKVKNEFVGLVKSAFVRAHEGIERLIAQQDTFLDGMERRFQEFSDNAIESLGRHSLKDITGAYPSWNPLDGDSASASSSLGMTLDAAESCPKVGAEANWFFSTLMEHAPNVSGGGMFAYDASSMDPFSAKLKEVFDEVVGPRAMSAFEKAAAYFQEIGSHPEAIGQLLLQGILEACSGLVLFGIDLVRKMLGLLLRAVQSVLKQLLGVMASPIEIPVLSWLYKHFTGDDLTMLNLGALVIAAPTVVILKALNVRLSGSLQHAAPSQPSASEMTTGQRICKTGQAIANLLRGVVQNVANPIAAELDATGTTGVALQALRTAFGAVAVGLSAPWIYYADPSASKITSWVFGLIHILALPWWALRLAIGVPSAVFSLKNMISVDVYYMVPVVSFQWSWKTFLTAAFKSLSELVTIVVTIIHQVCHMIGVGFAIAASVIQTNLEHVLSLLNTCFGWGESLLRVAAFLFGVCAKIAKDPAMKFGFKAAKGAAYAGAELGSAVGFGITLAATWPERFGIHEAALA